MLREIEKENAIRDSRKQQRQKASEDSSAKAKTTSEPVVKPSGPNSSSFY